MQSDSHVSFIILSSVLQNNSIRFLLLVYIFSFAVSYGRERESVSHNCWTFISICSQINPLCCFLRQLKQIGNDLKNLDKTSNAFRIRLLRRSIYIATRRSTTYYTDTTFTKYTHNLEYICVMSNLEVVGPRALFLPPLEAQKQQCNSGSLCLYFEVYTISSSQSGNVVLQ